MKKPTASGGYESRRGALFQLYITLGCPRGAPRRGARVLVDFKEARTASRRRLDLPVFIVHDFGPLVSECELCEVVLDQFPKIRDLLLT